MSSVFNIALNGLNDAVRRIANAASSIVNASSTAPSPKNPSDLYAGLQDTITLSDKAGADLNADLVDAKIAQVNYAANVAVIKTAKKMDKSLLDVLS